MTAVVDFFVEIFERIGRFLGFGVLPRRDDPFSERKAPGLVRLLRWLWPLAVLFLVAWLAVMVYRFSFWRGVTVDFPQTVLAQIDAHAPAPSAEGEAQATPGQCPISRSVAMQAALIDLMVNRNDWVPATPQYTIGIFGLIDWADTPWFDNKASFQLGVLTVLRRYGLDLGDTIGRARGTAGADPDLQGAASRLRIDPRAWVFNNPFDARLATFTTSAASSYRGAIALYERYNERLRNCEATFDARGDNLHSLLDRLAADLGDVGDRLQRRASATRWSVTDKAFVPAEGNNRGWFDFRADNLFHEARGQLFALHALMQAVRIDFAAVERRSQYTEVWDRMESHLAEGAQLNPLIVSNGREDGILAPDHLSVMGERVLRPRANMTELREVLVPR